MLYFIHFPFPKRLETKWTDYSLEDLEGVSDTILPVFFAFHLPSASQKKIRKLLPISFFSMLSLGESSQFWPSKRLVWSWAAPGKSSCAATATTSLPRLCCGTGSAWFGRRMRRRRRTWRMRFWRCCPCGDGLIDVDIPWCSHIYISSSMGNLYWSKNHFFHGTMEYLIFLYGQIMGKMKVKIRRFFCGIRRWEYRISCGKTNALNCKPTFFGIIFWPPIYGLFLGFPTLGEFLLQRSFLWGWEI